MHNSRFFCMKNETLFFFFFWIINAIVNHFSNPFVMLFYISKLDHLLICGSKKSRTKTNKLKFKEDWYKQDDKKFVISFINQKITEII